MQIPTITSPAEAQEFVDARIAEGSDYIKVIYDDGRPHGRTIPTLNGGTPAAPTRNPVGLADMVPKLPGLRVVMLF